MLRARGAERVSMAVKYGTVEGQETLGTPPVYLDSQRCEHVTCCAYDTGRRRIKVDLRERSRSKSSRVENCAHARLDQGCEANRWDR
jgi:hypothetical protein